MTKKPSKQAIIYCRTATKILKRYDHSLAKQEDESRKYAEKYNIEVLEVFRDSGIASPPQTRAGFIGMCEYIRDLKQPVLVIISDYSRISRDLAELHDTFYLLEDVHGAEICDIPAIEEKLLLKRFNREAKLDALLKKVMKTLESHSEQCAALFSEIADVMDEAEGWCE